MRTSALLLLAVLGCISQGPDIPRVNAGNGVTVDSATNTVSIDTAKVPVLPACTQGQVVVRTADGWICSDGGAANADTVDGKHAADLLGATAQAADSAKLGGQVASAYLSLDASGNYVPAGDLALGAYRISLKHTIPLCLIGRVCSASTSVSGKYCGQTSAVNGALSWSAGGITATGYAAGKKLCEAACGSALAHMCTGDEVARSFQIGAGFAGPVWYVPGLGDDCNGWSDATTAHYGMNWSPFGSKSCDATLPIACCL